jgi:SAM-dependent methyltransferase
MTDIRFEDIDWNLLWQKARESATRKSKTSADWDRKADSFAGRNTRGVYNNLFISLLKPDRSWSVLDVGCGPGTLAIPLAAMVKRVTALDFSSRMLEILEQRSAEKELTNISAHRLSWTDDWRQHGITMHDAVIASRSLAVEDLRQALEKLTSFAARTVVVSDRVGSGPFDPDAFAAVGRQLRPGPDYIYTVNLLYRMGIQASVDFITLEDQHRYSSLEEAVDNYSWMFSDLTDREKKQLEDYVRSISFPLAGGIVTLRPRHIPAWAVIRWSPSGSVANY